MDRQLLVTSKGEETPRLFNDTKDRIKQIEGAIVKAINERRGAWRAASTILQLGKEGETEQPWTQKSDIVPSGQEAHSGVCAQQTFRDPDSAGISTPKSKSNYWPQWVKVNFNMKL